MITIIINGIYGRVGQTIVRNLENDGEITVGGGCDIKDSAIPGSGIPVSNDLAAVIQRGEVIIDFSLPEGTIEKLPVCVAHEKPLIIGTTGFNEVQTALIREASLRIPVILSSNMSIGANLLFKLTEMAARVLDDSYDAEIVEAHHKFKKDAPSGTALTAGERIAGARNSDSRSVFRFGRERTGTRGKGEITFHSVRGGNILSEHSVLFYGDHEILEISHRAYSRDVFMEGIRKAVKFILTKKNGLYDMQDVLGLK